MKQIPCPDCDERGFHMRFEDNNGARRAWNELCNTCGGKGYIEAITTNANVIRRMSDEELADLFADWDFCSDVCSQQYSDNPLVGKCPENCKEQALKWLRQPVKEGTND